MTCFGCGICYPRSFYSDKEALKLSGRSKCPGCSGRVYVSLNYWVTFQNILTARRTAPMRTSYPSIRQSVRFHPRRIEEHANPGDTRSEEEFSSLIDMTEENSPSISLVEKCFMPPTGGVIYSDTPYWALF